MYDVIVVGGGAAGMFAAITAANAGSRVLLLEKNPHRLGKKLNITGKGRCNVTNRCTAEEVLKNVPRNSRFLYSAMAGFPPEDAMAFFEAHGCPLKTERGNRVFPVSDRAQSVIDALKSALTEAGVEVRYAAAEGLLTRDGRVSGVHTAQKDFAAPRVILCTGGCSYPATGSTGDGYPMAAAVGHTIVEPTGSLVPMVEDGHWCARMQGLSLRNVNVRLLDDRGKTVHEEFGELLFTHFGLSGPVILSMSAHMGKKASYTVSIDLKPALDEQKLDARILRDFGENRNRNFENALSGLFHKTMIPVIVERSGIPPQLRVNAVTRQQRRALLELTKHFTVKIAGLRPVEEAIITSGGVDVKQIDPRTMESKCLPGLYFAGEIIDCDAYTGGFNLQIAWATAYAAGNAAGEK
ncbi:MAG: NAD(P)/FAD-dependent oxidoreductase [Firmicutes bacterium]|nr:NAD(P)/FAD-dependent oxidoreductase [Bacillota bacterium]MDY2719623.1 NAD(P)/FAD-dependent oxidoreductase [Candidatus Faecousia sp.]